MILESKVINDWIFLHNALPNQYWDPTSPALEAPPASPTQQSHASSSGISSTLPPSTDTNAQLHWLCTQFLAFNADYQVFKSDVYDRLDSIENT
jgi:hypothetical protein